jgi:hypothetical protein
MYHSKVLNRNYLVLMPFDFKSICFGISPPGVAGVAASALAPALVLPLFSPVSRKIKK